MKPFIISLWFDKEAEEAAKFYTSVFKDGKIGKYAYYGKEGFEHHGRPEGSVMTVNFRANGQEFVALNGGPIFQFNESVSFMVMCETQSEIDEYWKKLTADGGKEVQCGWLKDKFGMSWQVVPTIMDEMMTDPDPVKRSRVMNEMFKHVKFDIERLKKAYKG